MSHPERKQDIPEVTLDLGLVPESLLFSPVYCDHGVIVSIMIYQDGIITHPFVSCRLNHFYEVE